MKRTRLIATLVGLAVVALFAGNAVARGRMYDPGMGRFLQRDPIGTPLEPPMARNLSGSQFTSRDSTSQYADGMNLHQYARSNPQRWLDPHGLRVAATCQEPGTWSAVPLDFGIAAGQAMNPDAAATAIKVTALLEFLGGVPQGGVDLIGSVVESVSSGGLVSPAGFPDTTIRTAELIKKIVQQRAFMWVKVRCMKCECDKDPRNGNTWQHRHAVWHQCTFTDIDTGRLPRERFGLDAEIVKDVSKLGLIPLSNLTRKDLEALKEACKWDARFAGAVLCAP